MPDRYRPDDILDVVAGYAPTATVLAREWSPSREAVAELVDDTTGPVHIVPPRPHRRWVFARSAVAASVVVLALAIAALVVVLTRVSPPSGVGAAGTGSGPAFDPPAGLSDRSLPDGAYSYRVEESGDLDASGHIVPHGLDYGIDRSWVSAAGVTYSVRSGSQTGCYVFARTGNLIEEPTRAYLASLPTDTGALRTYLRSHVDGSSSLDEAVFVAVGTALSTADGLASPRLRAAMVAVLSRTAGVHVWHDRRDQLGRPAIRLDFVNQKIRPGEVDSMYFDPTDFRLLERSSSSNGQPTSYDGPSPAYDSPAPANGDDPETTTPLGIELMTTEAVVTTLPSSLRHCPNG